jgi:hypothetical protein
MGIASDTMRVVAAALGGVLGLASQRRAHGEEWIAECPDTETTTAITLDAAGRVTGCSHWPERKHCDRSCAGGMNDKRTESPGCAPVHW